MSGSIAILGELGKLGVILHVDHGTLRFRAPAGTMTLDLIQRLRAQRRELIDFISSADTVGLHPSYAKIRLSPDIQVLHRNPVCRSQLWWQHVGGQHACLWCHPPTHPAVIAKTNYRGMVPVVNWRDSS